MPSPDAEIERRCGAWIGKNLGGYTGMLNLETIGGVIIEVHLRFLRPVAGSLRRRLGGRRGTLVRGRRVGIRRPRTARRLSASFYSVRTA